MEEIRHLGIKTFWMFVLSNSKPVFAFLLAALVSIIAKGYVGNDALISILDYIAPIAIALSGLFLVLALCISWLVYTNYTFSITDDAFKLKHGILNKEETAIPYRQIQSVDLRQDLVGQILGLSRVVILTAGRDNNDTEGEAEAKFPIMDTELAKQLQAELLKRSQTEKVIVEK